MGKDKKIDDIVEVIIGFNCYNCKYSTVLENDKVLCDKKEFENKTIIIDIDKANIDCPSHSEINGLTPTYNTGYIFTSDDYCAICHRKLLNQEMTVKDNNLHRNICVKCDSYKKIICNNCETKNESKDSERG